MEHSQDGSLQGDDAAGAREVRKYAGLHVHQLCLCELSANIAYLGDSVTKSATCLLNELYVLSRLQHCCQEAEHEPGCQGRSVNSSVLLLYKDTVGDLGSVHFCA